MTSNQLEAVANKQEKYIKNLKKIYKTQWDEINPIILKHESQSEQDKTINSALQTQESSAQTIAQEQSEKKEEEQQITNAKIYEQQDVDLLDSITDGTAMQVDINQYLKLKEEVDRLQRQCAQVCEEMRRLQEENDDLNVAFEGEQQHKDRLMQNKKSEIEQLTSNNSRLEEKQANLVLELEALQFQFEQKEKEVDTLKKQIKLTDTQRINLLNQNESFQLRLNQLEEDQVLLTNQSDSKTKKEIINVTTLVKDVERLTDQINEQKLELDSLYAVKMKQDNTICQLRQKRQRDKETLLYQQEIQKDCQAQLVQAKLQHNQEIQTLNTIINQIKDDFGGQKDDNNIMDGKQVEIQFVENNLNKLQQENEIKDLLLAFNVSEKQRNGLIAQIEDKDLQISSFQSQIALLLKKREFAITEIQNLTNTIASLQRNKNTQIIIPQTTTPDLGNKKKKLSVFQTLKKVGVDIRQLLDSVYKEFVNFLITNKDLLDLKVQTSLISIEKKINDCNRRTQDFLDLFDDIGIR